MDSPSLEEAKSELAAVKQRVSEVKERVDQLEHLHNHWWQKRDRAEKRNEKEKLAEAERNVEKYERSLIRAKDSLKQLKASRDSLTARIQEAEQAEEDLPISFALMTALERERKLRRLMEIAEVE